MSNQSSKAPLVTNLAVLANAVEVGAQVVAEVAGNAVANTIDGKMVTPSTLHNAIASRIHSALASKIGGP